MASTTFVSNVTKIVRAWLQDVNDCVYGPTAPTTTLRGQLADPTSASSGDAMYAVQRSETGAVATTGHALNQSRWVDVKSDGGCAVDGVTTGDVAKVQTLINSGPGTFWFASGTWLWDADLTIPDNVWLVFARGAVLKASANGRIFFKSLTTAYFSRITGAWLDGNGKTGVFAGDFTNFRLGSAGIYECFLTDMSDGFVFRFGCYAVQVANLSTFNGVTRPLRFTASAGSACVFNPILDNQSGTGAGTGTAIVVDNTGGTTIGPRVVGGYVQGFGIGIDDGGVGTTVDGTYFETCTTADVYFNGARGSEVRNTQHNASVGACAVKARNSDACTVFKPNMVSSGRSTGLLDFDATNTNCAYYDSGSNASWNTPLGVVTGIDKIVKQKTATYTPVMIGSGAAGAGTYTVQSGKYSITGNTVTFNQTVAITAHTGTGNIGFTGLPTALAPTAFTIATNFQVTVSGMAFTGPLLWAGFNGTNTSISLYQSDAAGNVSLVPIDTACTINISGSYEM